MKLFDRIAQRIAAWSGRVVPVPPINVVNHVTINVSGSEDPSHVARRVLDEFRRRTEPS